jgi:cardiolipin synthase
LEYLSTHLTKVLTVVDILAIVIAIPVVLSIKRGTTSAVAWCLVILVLPLVGPLLFWVFGYTYLHRPLRRKRIQRATFGLRLPPEAKEAIAENTTWKDLGRIAWQLDDSPPCAGNAVTLFPDTQAAYAALFEEIAAAKHHVNAEFYIIRADKTGKEFLALLTEKARQGVTVRLLFDSLGGFFLGRRALHKLTAAGGRVAAFLPLNLFRSRLRVNLRNHRKLVVIDGRVGFTGGMNIGNEYLGRDPAFGVWRDQALRLEGPAVARLQRVFAEDWDFTTKEMLKGSKYYPPLRGVGDAIVQVVASGPDQEVNVSREFYFASLATARERVWIATPYFVPGPGILDALRLACYRGADVRLLLPRVGDHWITQCASRYYWDDVLASGAKIFLYTKGMMHAKYLTFDGNWAVVGSANVDNRSLNLNFEVGCALFDPKLTAALEQAFLRDQEDAVPVDRKTFERRGYRARLAENACRLFSPVL